MNTGHSWPPPLLAAGSLVVTPQTHLQCHCTKRYPAQWRLLSGGQLIITAGMECYDPSSPQQPPLTQHHLDMCSTKVQPSHSATISVRPTSHTVWCNRSINQGFHHTERTAAFQGKWMYLWCTKLQRWCRVIEALEHWASNRKIASLSCWAK
jgi:hypothetical protein